MTQTDIAPTFTMTPKLVKLREAPTAKEIKIIFEGSLSKEVWGITYHNHNNETV